MDMVKKLTDEIEALEDQLHDLKSERLSLERLIELNPLIPLAEQLHHSLDVHCEDGWGYTIWADAIGPTGQPITDNVRGAYLKRVEDLAGEIDRLNSIKDETREVSIDIRDFANLVKDFRGY